MKNKLDEIIAKVEKRIMADVEGDLRGYCLLLQEQRANAILLDERPALKGMDE